MLNKIEALKRLSNKDGVIAALAIDQRGSLKKMLASAANKPANEEDIVEFKKVISHEKMYVQKTAALWDAKVFEFKSLF